MKPAGIAKTLLKAAITAVLLAYLLLSIDAGVIVFTILGMDTVLLCLCLPLIVVMYSIRAEKWRALLKPIGVEMPFFRSLKIYLIGTFYGSVTPGRAGEISRSFFMGDKKFRTVPTVVIDRVMDIACLLALSAITIAVFFHSVELAAILAALFVVFTAGTIVLLHREAVSFLFGIFRVGDEQRKDYLDTVGEVLGDRKAMASAFALTLAYYAVNTLAFWLILRALSTAIDPIVALSLPVIIIMGNVPVSISGLGVREFVSVTVFSMFGESAAHGFSASLVLYLLTSLLPGLVGSLFTLEGARSPETGKHEMVRR